MLGRRVVAGLLAGAAALAVNMAALGLAGLFGVSTGYGGLLRLLASAAGLWIPPSAAVQDGFHVLVGLGMAVAYALFLQPVWPGRAIRLALIVAAVVWGLNAFVVLPSTGEGFAGTQHVGLVGVLWFATAHTLFFLGLAIGFDRLRPDAVGVEKRAGPG